MADLTKPTGSLVNNLYANSSYQKPEVGMGATELGFTDRRAHTIVEVVDDKTIIVQRDRATRTDKNGMSESQSYDYAPQPQSRRITVTLRDNGRWVTKDESDKKGTAFAIGIRDEYYDFSF